MRSSGTIFPTVFMVFLLFSESANSARRPNDPPSINITTKYAHDWIKFPILKGPAVFGNRAKNIKPVKGVVTIIVFISSWDISSQSLLPKIRKIEKKYKDLYTRVSYVFSHDLRIDARNFAKEFKMDTHNLVLADTKLLKTFHNPPLVSIYMSDRRGWLNHRIIKAKEKDLKKLDTMISKMVRY